MRPLAPLNGDMADHALMLVDVTLRSGGSQCYFMPVSRLWGEQHTRFGAPKLSYVMARLRRGPRIAALLDAGHDETFARVFVDRLRQGGSLDCAAGEVHFEATDALSSADLSDTVRPIGAEQSNVSVIVGNAVLLKIYRRLLPGTQPEVEVARFLSQVAGYQNTPAYLGSAELRLQDGTTSALAAAFAYVNNQGDGWTVITDALGRLLEETAMSHGAFPATTVGTTAESLFAFPLDLGMPLGRRTAEMHAAAHECQCYRGKTLSMASVLA